MKDRIKKLRKTLNLTQQEFADRLGISRGNIATYETRDGSPGNSVVNLICREFNVSEDWLRTGEGEMFVPKEEDALDELVKQYKLSDGDHILIEKFLKLKPVERQAVISYMKDVVAALNAGKDIPAPAPADTAGQERTEVDIAAELAELKRQNQALAAEVAALKEEDTAWEEAQKAAKGLFRSR